MYVCYKGGMIPKSGLRFSDWIMPKQKEATSPGLVVESSRGDDADAGQAAFRRAKPAGGRDHPRGNRAPSHLPAIAGRAGQAQPFDAREGARRAPSVYTGDHGAARTG